MKIKYLCPICQEGFDKKRKFCSECKSKVLQVCSSSYSQYHHNFTFGVYTGGENERKNN